MLAKNVQRELAYTSLRTVTGAVEIWYYPVEWSGLALKADSLTECVAGRGLRRPYRRTVAL